MARTRDRVFALVVALTFLVSTVGVSAAIVWQVVQDGRDEPPAESADFSNTEENSNGLKGTKMDNFTPVAKVDSLQVIDLEPGTGQEVKAGDRVTVDYTGALAATGSIFQSSLDTGQQASFKLDEVIPGWRDGLVGMKVGGKRRLLIPAAQAYGSNSPSADIPADSDLVFDVILHKIGE